MTDHPYSCKHSPNGKHKVIAGSVECAYCHRTLSYLMDLGWNVPAHDPDWHDQEVDINDTKEKG